MFTGNLYIFKKKKKHPPSNLMIPTGIVHICFRIPIFWVNKSQRIRIPARIHMILNKTRQDPNPAPGPGPKFT